MRERPRAQAGIEPVTARQSHPGVSASRRVDGATLIVCQPTDHPRRDRPAVGRWREGRRSTGMADVPGPSAGIPRQDRRPAQAGDWLILVAAAMPPIEERRGPYPHRSDAPSTRTLAGIVGAHAASRVRPTGSTTQRVDRPIGSEYGRIPAGPHGEGGAARRLVAMKGGRSGPVQLPLGGEGLDLDDARGGRPVRPMVRSGLAGDTEVAAEAIGPGATGGRGCWSNRRGHHRHQQGHCGGEVNGGFEERSVGHRHSNPR
jgi:hypothetical protein